MNTPHIARVAAERALTVAQTQAVAGLLEEGATVPFIARYRKEATGSLDEVAVAAIRDRQPGDEIVIVLLRDGEMVTVEVTLTSYPSDLDR